MADDVDYDDGWYCGMYYPAEMAQYIGEETIQYEGDSGSDVETAEKAMDEGEEFSMVEDGYVEERPRPPTISITLKPEGLEEYSRDI